MDTTFALVPSNCLRCGYKGEAILSIAGPHIKKECGNCGRYVKFISPMELPGLRQVKLKILELVEGDLTAIETKKTAIKFNKNLSPDTTAGLVEYWKLYRSLITKNDEGKQRSLSL